MWWGTTSRLWLLPVSGWVCWIFLLEGSGEVPSLTRSVFYTWCQFHMNTTKITMVWSIVTFFPTTMFIHFQFVVSICQILCGVCVKAYGTQFFSLGESGYGCVEKFRAWVGEMPCNLVINGVIGPLKMAENKWVNGTYRGISPTYTS